MVPLGRDIGYLPGTVEEKLHSWMLPIYDNMEFIMHSSQVGQHFEELDGDRYERRKGEKISKGTRQTGKMVSLRPMDDLVKNGKLSLRSNHLYAWSLNSLSIYSY